MRELLACAKWELLWQWRQARARKGWLLFEAIWFPIYSVSLARNASDKWFVFLGSGLVTIGVVLFLVTRAFAWLFSGTFALERTSGRAGWQSVLGRCVVWLPELCGAELFRQLVVWVSIERDVANMVAKRHVGVFVFDTAEAAGWMGPAAFLGAVCATFGVCVSALTISLLTKSGKMRHKAKTLDGYTYLFVVALIVGVFWYYFRFSWTALGAVCIVIGLPMSCSLLEHRVE